MKVLHIINSMKVGGAERLLLELVPQFQSLGISIDVLLLDSTNSPFFEKLKMILKGEIHYVKYKNKYNPLVIFEIAKYFKKYDLIHVHLFPGLYWASIAKWIFRCETQMIFTEHSTKNRRLNHGFFRIIDKLIYRQYSSIIAITPQVKEVLQNKLKIKSNTIYTIYNGINGMKYRNACPCSREKFGLNTKNVILIQVSRFSKAKDQRTVVSSLCYLPSNFVLLLVGVGEMLEEVKLLANKLSLSDRVFFLGLRTDVESLLKMSDVVIQSSHWEGFGLAAVEGMAAGKPVVASDVPGLSEVVKDAGILFEKSNSEHLSHSILSLFEDKEYYSLVARKCFERSQKYSIEKMAEQYIYIYKNIYNEGNKNI